MRGRLATLYGVLGVTLLLTSCSTRKCQPTEAVTTFLNQEFRLVASNNPVYQRTLTNFSFPIISFSSTFRVSVFEVKNNFRLSAQTLGGEYTFDPVNMILTIQYTIPPTQPQSEQDIGTNTGQPEVYKVSFGTQFKMQTQSPNNYYYTWVPFKGGVNPDLNCTF